MKNKLWFLKRWLLDAFYGFNRKMYIRNWTVVRDSRLGPEYGIDTTRVIELVRDTDIRDRNILYSMMHRALDEDDDNWVVSNDSSRTD